MKTFVVASIVLAAVLSAAPALAQQPQTSGVVDAARESLFGDVYAEPSTWRPLSAGTFFSEGWNEPWASPPRPARAGHRARAGSTPPTASSTGSAS